MPPKRPFVASFNEVRIRREGEAALIEYADPAVWPTHFTIGREIEALTDEEILARWNDRVRATEELAAQYEHECVEIPPGKPQIRWEERLGSWQMRGDVLRAQLHDDEDRNPKVEIDGRELTWDELGAMLVTFSGWGFRLCIVPDDETHELPTIVVRDADDADA